MNDSQFFPGAQPLRSFSVPCPSYSLIRILFSFPSLTGSLTGSSTSSLTDTKFACLNGGFRSISIRCSGSLFLWKLVFFCECCTLVIYLLLYFGTMPACLFEEFRSRSTGYSSFSFCLASVLLLCSLCQVYVVRVLLISFPRITGSLTGTKPACLTGGFRSRATICSTSFFFLWKLVYECCTLGIHQ